MTAINRKTGIPIKSIPRIVEWLLGNSTLAQLQFMNSFANDRSKFPLMTAIFTNLTDRNVYEVFYERINNPQELADFRSAKRGEVAGLKAFQMACQAAGAELERRRKERLKKKRGDIDG